MGSRTIFLINQYLKDVNPREAGEEICRTESKAGPFYRPHYLLHYVLSGSGTFYIDGQRYDAVRGQLAILHPYEVMSHVTNRDDPWHYCWVGFELNLDAPVLKNHKILDIPQAEHIFQSIIRSEQVLQGKELYLCGKIYELLAILQQMEGQTERQTLDTIAKMKNYIDSNYHLPLTVEKLAQDMHVSRSYLSTVFKRYVGCSPHQYLMDTRLKHAAELLVVERCSVSMAAAQCGYMDIYNFSRMFKKKYGISPSAYADWYMRGEKRPEEGLSDVGI